MLEVTKARETINTLIMKVIRVLRGVSLEVHEGKLVSLLGANGAGKTTTLKAVSGMLKTEEGEVTDGSIEFEGKRIESYGPETIAAMGISQAMEGRRVLEHLSVEENWFVGAYCRKDRAGVKKDLALVFDYFPKIKLLRQRTSGYLSGGEQQMLVIGRALMARPRLMLLDEPSLGLAPRVVEDIFALSTESGPRQLRVLATQQEGYISGETLHRIDNPEEFLVISNWQSFDAWQNWLNSSQRKELQSKIDLLLGRETTYEVYQYGLAD